MCHEIRTKYTYLLENIQSDGEINADETIDVCCYDRASMSIMKLSFFGF